MKKLYFIIVLLFAAIPLMAERVAPETAKKAAATFLNNNGAKAAQLTDLSKEAGFQHLYVFNAEQGFVVMAADDRVQPILGYSLTGKFVAEDMPTNVRGWLQGYNDEIQYAIESQERATPETAQLWKDLVEGNSKAGLATAVVNNLLQTTWDQDPVYNDLCPYDNSAHERTVTGCVATAMAQIMKYWEYPNHGVGSHSYTPETHPEYGVQSVNYGASTYDWANMPLDRANSEIAKLMYHCGVSVDMDYDLAANGGSGAVTAYVVNALQTYFNYQPCTYKERSSYQSTWVSMLKAELDARRPLQYSGRGTGGHSFVCCGYDNNNRFYFNWGWSGRNDGFYALTSLVPGSGGSGGSSYNFTNDQAAIFGIQPVQCDAGEPSNLTYTREGFSVTLNWTAGEGASNYNVYRNDVVIGNVTNTTYTDNINYGTYNYYVKSKDANGSQSLPSNTVTVTIEPVPTDLTATLNGSNIALTWAEPEWSAPQTGDEILTYGNGNMGSMFGVTDARGYYGHRYPVSMLSANKVLYKVSFYAAVTGSFAAYIYSANSGSAKPQTLLGTKSVTASTTGWCDIELNAEEFIHINNNKDLWVFIYDPEGKQHPMGIETTTNADGAYFSAQESNGPTNWVGSVEGGTMLIRTYITDDSFQYNLYDNNTLVASNLSGTSHTLSNVGNNIVHQYTLRTIFNDGETSNSNMVGLTLGTASLVNLELAENDKMTITEGSFLTVTDTLSSSNAESLVLENGAQLVTASEDVQATVEKAITGYGGGNGKNDYTLLAIPVMDDLTIADIAGMTEDNYDLYYFDQNQVKEWINYKQTDNNFTDLVNGIGYLYANSEDKTLSFAGEIHPTNADISMDLEYHEGQPFTGFNLVGNPFTCNAYIDKTDFYVISETAEGSEIMTAESAVIAPMQGLFVIAKGPSDQVVFSNEPSRQDGKSLDIRLNHADGSNLDMARIRFGEGTGLRKMLLNPDHTKVYLPKNGTNYAVAFTENNAGEMPVCFKTEHNGTYTITISSPLTSNLSPLTYLHLIDHLTGADVDLLSNPSYTFNAKSDDYASRFLLRFSNDSTLPDNDSEQFAYYADGKIHVIGDYQTMEVFDLTGRALSATEHLAPGVYMVQITINQEIKTQKIIVK